MSDLMREDFEAACEARFNWTLQDPYRDESERTISTWDGESYRNRIVQGMWWAWQASRECLVIDLPEDFPFSKEPKYQSSRQQTISECSAAIHAAGVKTK